MVAKKVALRSMARFTSARVAKIIGILILFLLLLPLLTHYYISKYDSQVSSSSLADNLPNRQGFQLESNGVRSDPISDLDAALKMKDLASRIKEMVRIRGSVSDELRSLEGKRQKLQSEISSLSARVDELKSLCSRKQADLEQVRISLDQIQDDQKEANLQNQPFIARPLRLLPDEAPNVNLLQLHNFHKKQGLHSTAANDELGHSKKKNSRSCTMRNCFDYSRCSLTSGFPVYFYHPSGGNGGIDDDDDENSDFGRENLVGGGHSRPDGGDVITEKPSQKSAVLEAFNLSKHVTFDAAISCAYIVILLEQQYQRHNKSTQIDSYLRSLPFWGKDGQNHVIFNFVRDLDILEAGVDLGKALVIQSKFNGTTFRQNFDVVFNVAALTSGASGSNHAFSPDEDLPSAHCPAKRKYLGTFQGYLSKNSRLQTIASVLREIEAKSSADSFLFEFDAVPPSAHAAAGAGAVANDASALLLRQSTFALILPPEEDDLISSASINDCITAALRAGAVPVVLGGDYLRLPFDDVIDWSRVALLVPLARVTELHFLLKTISDGDLLQMKRQGSLVLLRYLAGLRASVDTALAVIRQKRLQIAAPAVRDEPSLMLFNASYPMKYFDPTENNAANPDSMEPEENLGPLEPPFPSISYRRNYSLTFTHGYELWNEMSLDPFATYPFLPQDPELPSEAKFVGSAYGYRPIGGGAGGAGREFSERLGGNVPKEQFTIVMLTYEREAVLIDSLQRLKSLPYLNKILVVWNSPNKMPSPDLRWPDVGVPIEVVRTKENSLNNRFKPYDEIETEAILSMDDDAHLRHDEIIFGFRVWREARDRIVGFPGRYHAWDGENGGWHYNSNYSCELSMVLTGAAFFHKYYSYLYSYTMPSPIRDKVDEYVNCEDIAMNFLVSHVTRKPPIKVTSRWTFRCPGCPVSLSEDDSHFQERHRCINYFTQVYGYNPLLNTQFRADSVLFKTRIPHDKQKCFKFI